MNEDSDDKISNLTPIYFELDSAKMRNRSISTEVVGGIHGTRKSGESCNCLLAVATIDGTLMLVDDQHILWSLQVDHQVFALAKLDVINDGKEELIACAWDGQTYIVTQDRSTVRFEFEEPVSAFIAGYYSIGSHVSGNNNVPCFVYVTFSNTIHLYFNVKLNSMNPNNLKEIVDEETAQEINKLRKYLSVSESMYTTI
ncbi:integrin-alpha FG-GAP repeat-containing protein 2-like protein [Leptotrombidium deliense]|uniref:Integrin-alpha FG-GAP repeat-containing protein 2-like protein n=1 Tax=Leptotrombidium deliense TaxID=299467 RepID=A0A443SKF7_9ACAR|nr:integrin-alpha FG-GAP repeat-containing protein 2-like protein [Leptotrombidium deliense]